MTTKSAYKALSFLLSLLLLVGVFPAAAYTAFAAETEISLPIVIDGSSLVGITSPVGLSDLPASSEYSHCDNTCGVGEWYVSNRWYDMYDQVAESFVDGETYYFQISIHPKEGYKLPAEIEAPNSASERREGIVINGVNWERVEGDVDIISNTYYVMFYITYNAEGGISNEPLAFPIRIDGSSLAGITSPTGIDSLPSSDQYCYCDSSFGDGRYVSNQWYNADDGYPATDFEHGKEYYFQIAIHPQTGYVFPDSFDVDNSLQVYGIDWSHVNGGYLADYEIYFVEFYITYDENEGVPFAPPTEISLPIVIDGSSLVGITSPVGLSELPESYEYSHCDNTCGVGEWYVSNRWYDMYDQVAESFVDGETYYFQISIHPKEGYKLPAEIEAPNSASERREGIVINGVNWERVEGDVDILSNTYYVMFYITYNADGGMSNESLTFPIEIDGSSLAGITTPSGISNLPVSDEYYYCDGTCSEQLFCSNVWKDVIRDEVATSFENGRRYYFEIAIHPRAGYKLPDDFDVNDIYQNMTVTGVEWEDVIGGISETYNTYWMDFYITYNEDVGIPTELKEIQLPLIIDGSSLVGISAPTGISNLPVSEEFHYCDNSCNGYFTSNTWYDMTDQEVQSFVDGEEYYYQIAIHPNEGYKLPKNFDQYNGIKVEGFEWIGLNAGVNSAFNVYWVEFHFVYRESTEDKDILLGDVNLDGAVNSLDAAQVLKHDAQIISLEGDSLTAADVNGDGSINSLDAAMILRFDAGLINGF